MESQVTSLRWISFLEGLSLLALFFVAMPLKYVWGMPLPTRIVGSLHGLLFLVLLYAVHQAYLELKWSKMFAVVLVVLACLPFGFVFADRRIRAEISPR